MATGLVFVTGLVAVWFALSERAVEEPVPDSDREPVTPAPSVEPGLFTHRPVPGPATRRPLPAAR